MRLLALLAAITLQASGGLAQGPPLPYEDRGACPFECCTYRDWTAEIPLTAYESHDPRAPKTAVFTIAAGERVTAMTGLVRTIVAGEAVVTAPTSVDVLSHKFPMNRAETLTFEPGDRVYLLAPRGEGWMSGWYRGRVLDEFDATMFGRTEDCEKRRRCTGTIERAPEIDWWVRIRNARGRIGWVLMPRAKRAFNGPDACGAPSPENRTKNREPRTENAEP